MSGQPKLVLASSSPRRRELLVQLGVEPDRVAAPDIDETPRPDELPRLYTRRMAEEKALAVQRMDGGIVLAGDTSVAMGRRILPKAMSGAEVAAFLEKLSGRRHDVWSAIAVIDREGCLRRRLTKNVVRFKRLSRDEIAAYAASEEGIGKAGGYAIQGRAAGLIDFVSGSYSGIVGLPLYETRVLLKASGFQVG